MAMTLGVGAKLVDPVVKKAINEGAKQFKTISQLYMNMDSSSQRFFEEVEVGGIGLLQQTVELEKIPAVDYSIADAKRYTAAGYGLSVVLSREVWQYDMLSVAKKTGSMLGQAAKASIDTLSADVLNNGATTETTPDGLTVFNAAHVDLRNGTYSNVPAAPAALDIGTLDTAYDAMRITKRHHVLPGGNDPKFIMYHPNNASVVHAILNSTHVPGSDNNDSNFFFSRLQPIENNLLTNTASWFLLTEKQFHSLKFVTFQAPKLSRWIQDNNKSIHYDVIMDVDTGATSGLGLHGVFPA